MAKTKYSPRYVKRQLITLALYALRYSPPTPKAPPVRASKRPPLYTIDRSTLYLRRFREGDSPFLRASFVIPFDRKRPVLARSSFLPDLRELADEVNALSPRSFPRVAARTSPDGESFELIPLAKVSRRRLEGLFRVALRALRKDSVGKSKKVPPRKSLP